MAIVARGFPGLTFGTTQWSATDSTKRTLAKESGLARCWQSFDISESAKITPAIKEEVRRHGFPQCLRADAYYFLSGASVLQLQQPACTYSTLAASTTDLSDETIFNVEDDVRNARFVFKDTRLFATAKGAEVLSRIIFSYLQRNPACGYFKGLAHIAALLLTAFGKEREEQAFWTLVALLERRFFPHTTGNVPSGSRVEVQLLQQLLEQRLPVLSGAMAKLRSDAVEQLCYSWFATAFTWTLPHEVVLRIWDCVLIEGPKVALRVAMALLKMFASSVQSCTNLEVLGRVMEGRLSRYTEADALLSVAFKGLGSLSGSYVDATRLRVMATTQKAQVGQAAPLFAGVTGAQSYSGSSSHPISGSSNSSSRAGSKQSSPSPSPIASGLLLGTT